MKTTKTMDKITCDLCTSIILKSEIKEYSHITGYPICPVCGVDIEIEQWKSLSSIKQEMKKEIMNDAELLQRCYASLSSIQREAHAGERVYVLGMRNAKRHDQLLKDLRERLQL
jgi:hypothetical protein